VKKGTMLDHNLLRLKVVDYIFSKTNVYGGGGPLTERKRFCFLKMLLISSPQNLTNLPIFLSFQVPVQCEDTDKVCMIYANR